MPPESADTDAGAPLLKSEAASEKEGRLRRWSRLVRERIIALSDDPKGSAMAVGLGFLLAVIPGVGVTFVLVVGGLFMKKRSLALVTGALLLNPYTIPPFYLASYRLGCRILRLQPLKLATFKKNFHVDERPAALDWHSIWLWLKSQIRSLEFVWDHIAPFGIGLGLFGLLSTAVVVGVSYLLFNAWHGYRETHPASHRAGAADSDG